VSTNHPPLIEALTNPAAFDHAVEHIDIIETHISWVVLTGQYAYKIKKPVNLGFLDFSTLARRRHFCEEELRLNRRLAPQIYLDVVAITQHGVGLRIGGTDEAIEYAVKMRQFDPARQLDRLLAQTTLTRGHVVEAALTLAHFHQQIATAPPGSAFGEPETVLAPMLENFRQLGPRLPHAAARLAVLEDFTRREFARLQAELAGRKRAGFVRECHGDAHLRNIALIGDKVVFFDCIEFSESLRWIDVISEVAFLVMDLQDRGAQEFARVCLNSYLGETGDYAGLVLLRFYQLYRALVRAKVEAIRMDQESTDAQAQHTDRESCEQYLALANGYTEARPRFLAVTHGLSGSGKTTLTEILIGCTDAIRLRSDVERKRLFGLAPLERSGAAVSGGIYSAEAGEKTYTHLAELAQTVLTAGFPVLVDAAFLRREQRERFRALAERLGAPFFILDVDTPPALLRQRVLARATAGRDASEASVAVLDNQLRTHEALERHEREDTITINGERLPDSADVAVSALQRRSIG